MRQRRSSSADKPDTWVDGCETGGDGVCIGVGHGQRPALCCLGYGRTSAVRVRITWLGFFVATHKWGVCSEEANITYLVVEMSTSG